MEYRKAYCGGPFTAVITVGLELVRMLHPDFAERGGRCLVKKMTKERIMGMVKKLRKRVDGKDEYGKVIPSKAKCAINQQRVDNFEINFDTGVLIE